MKEIRADRIFNVCNMAFLVFCLLITLYPLWYILVCSFSSAAEVVAGNVTLWPIGFNTDAYEAAFESKQLIVGFRNSLIYTVVGTLFNLVVTFMAAYPLSRSDFKARGGITALFAFTMMFNGGMIPSYLLVKDLKMLDTIWALVIPGALSVWNVILIRTFIQNSIPGDLLEAAQLDGCRDGQYLIKIVLPLSGPIIAVMVLFFAVGHWNSYFNALMYISKSDLYPLQIILRNILIQNQFDPSMMKNVDPRELMRQQNLRDLLKYSLIVIASVPVLAIYPFVQKYFIKGVMIGALKG